MSEGGSLLQAPTDAEAFMVSLRSIRKSGRVLYAFSQFYTPFHDLAIGWFFGHYEIFGCISAAVYEMDEMVEAGQSSEQAFSNLARLEGYLRTRLRYDQPISELFNDAREYYRFEHSLLEGVGFDLSHVINLTAKRSFDFRMMHRALFQLAGHEYDEQVFSWFQQFEILMEVEDDLQSFEADAARGTFNILTLAKCVCDRKAIDLVGDYRIGIEAALSDRLTDLTLRQQQAARRVLVDYRRIVPRPEIPRW